MLPAVLCFNIVHPGSVLIGPESELPGIVATVEGMWLKSKGIRPLKEPLSVEELPELPTRSHFPSALNASGRYERMS